MRQRKAIYSGAVVVMALLLSAWSCNNYAKAGQLAKDAAASVLVAQQVEIQAHKSGYIDDTLHQSIQAELLNLAAAGVQLDAVISQSHSASGAVAQLTVMNTLLTDLSQNKIAGIKDANTKTALAAAFLTIQTTLDNIASFGGK